MVYPPANPTSQIGQLQSEIEDVKRSLDMTVDAAIKDTVDHIGQRLSDHIGQRLSEIERRLSEIEQNINDLFYELWWEKYGSFHLSELRVGLEETSGYTLNDLCEKVRYGFIAGIRSKRKE